MKLSTRLFSAMILWYLSLGSPSICLGSNYFKTKKPNKMSASVKSEFSIHQLGKEIKNGNIQNVNLILSKSQHLINQLDETGKSPLMLAITSRKTGVIKHLLSHFGDHINFRLTDQRNHATALDYANFVETKHIYNMLIPYY